MTEAQALDFLHMHGDMALRLCRRLAGTDAEDLFQEAIVRLLPLTLREDDENAQRNLFYTICLNLYRNQYAKRRRRARYRANAPFLAEELAAGDDTQALAESIAAAKAARRAVSRLKDRYRLPIELFYFAGWSTAQIAAGLDMKETTVRTNLSRARNILRKELSQWQ